MRNVSPAASSSGLRNAAGYWRAMSSLARWSESSRPCGRQIRSNAVALPAGILDDIAVAGRTFGDDVRK